MNADADELARLHARVWRLEFAQELLLAVDNHDLRERPARILRMLIHLSYGKGETSVHIKSRRQLATLTGIAETHIRANLDFLTGAMAKYTAKHEIALSDVEPSKANLRLEDASPPLLEPTDPVANVLLRVLEQLDPSFLSLVEGEFLSRSQGEERGILEIHFAKLGERASANCLSE